MWLACNRPCLLCTRLFSQSPVLLIINLHVAAFILFVFGDFFFSFDKLPICFHFGGTLSPFCDKMPLQLQWRRMWLEEPARDVCLMPVVWAPEQLCLQDRLQRISSCPGRGSISPSFILWLEGWMRVKWGSLPATQRPCIQQLKVCFSKCLPLQRLGFFF